MWSWMWAKNWGWSFLAMYKHSPCRQRIFRQLSILKRMSGSSNFAISYAKNHMVTTGLSKIAMPPHQTLKYLKNIPGKWCILVSKLLEAVGSKTFSQCHSLLLGRKNYMKVSIAPPFPYHSWPDQDHKTKRTENKYVIYSKVFCIMFWFALQGGTYPFYDARAGNLLDSWFSASM